jgi:hypothetical protein
MHNAEQSRAEQSRVPCRVQTAVELELSPAEAPGPTKHFTAKARTGQKPTGIRPTGIRRVPARSALVG